MEGKRKDEEDIQNSLVVEEGRMVKFPLVPLPLISFTCISCCKILSAKRKLNNHNEQTQHHAYSAKKQTKKLCWGQLCALPIIKHLPIDALPCLLAQCDHFSRNSSLSKLMLVVHGACRPSIKMHERYLGKLISALPSATLPSRQGSASSSTYKVLLICWHLDLQVSRAGLWGN